MDKITKAFRMALSLDSAAAVVVAIVVVGVTINTSHVIMQNYSLERKVRLLEQKVAVSQAELDTQKAKNEYYATDYYLDIAARKQLSMGLPGETLLIIPKDTALKDVPEIAEQEGKLTTTTTVEASNMQKWYRFVQGDLLEGQD